MNIIQIEENVKQIISKITQDELNKQDFIYELLLAYGHRSQSVGRVRSGERNLAEDKQNTVFWKRQIYFKIAKQQDLHGLIDQMKNESRTESSKIRFLIVTDFKTLLAVDTKTQDTLDVPFGDLAKKFDFFLPWAGMEKAVYQGENPADVKAAEKLAKLFDEIKVDNFDEDDLNNKENLHQLNIFLSRLLFCYFAEDTEIFKDKQFTSAISKSNEDGSDLSSLIGRLFKVLNQSSEDRETDLPDYLADFPYVNGGLFKDDIQVPKFTRKSRRILIECGKDLDWSDINPDIFGSMFQAVVHTEQRSTMGQHYTSVPNIMKVIEPLFLNDLYEELEKNQDSINKLLKLQQRLGQLKIFDPACGSGNFLIIAYKELRKFEMELLKRVQELELEKTGQFSKPFSVIQVSQFYGIEIDDFAHEVAILSLWLAEHQMNMIFKVEFGESQPSLPLKQSGNIVCGNSLKLSWEELFPKLKDEVIYILGNPPYLGGKKLNEQQKNDMYACGLKNSMQLDYVSCWFIKAAEFSDKVKDLKVSFVSTSSICQGEQVHLLWPKLFLHNLKIIFAYKPFEWSNNAKDKAGVTCVIIGLSKNSTNKVKLYNGIGCSIESAISPYLLPINITWVKPHNKPLSKLPTMMMGSNPIDGTNLILNDDEYFIIKSQKPEILKFIKKYMGAIDLLKNTQRYCLWIEDKDLEEAMSYDFIRNRLEACKSYRINAGRDAKKVADFPHRFCYRVYQNKQAIIFPKTTSSQRNYVPCDLVSENTVINVDAFAIYEIQPYVLSILSSKMHNKWIELTSGRLGNGYRYSVKLTYNTFPLPNLTEEQVGQLNVAALNILSIREKYINKNLSDLYDNKKMPIDLLEAHLENDKLVDKLYKESEFKSDNERLECLFNLYKIMEVNND
ncbi:MAG: N-6 DNA methylase [Acinetobacter sp.]|uniref:class I SAM-dependent DNA methyltransferase n=1 Tax=Acinetobacter sp. TaxID=472 RepID=UPI00262CA622|nr:DNA methyltransferase [Acinetobacter sp.]MDD2946634.1 N-6 DNA methylase [Acinetobacter sp.]